MAEASVAYISASTNRHPYAADASGSSLIAFGSSKLIALWDAEWKSTCSVKAHEKAISSLAAHGDYIYTGASDSLVKIWRTEQAGMQQSLINIRSSLQEIQTITLRGKYALSLAATSLPGVQATILAIGGTDRNVQIWTRSEDQFVSAATLSGHEDWVRSLAFRQPIAEGDCLILASGSQDATIRLWNIEPYTARPSGASDNSKSHTSDELLDAFEASLGELADAEEGGRQISLKRHILTVRSPQSISEQFSITFDALLIGHEAGVTSLAWRPATPGTADTPPTLLSTSTDSSLILWSPSMILTAAPGADGATSIWINRQRFGDVGGQRLGGFVGGVWANGGAEAAAWGWSGGWRRWHCIGGGNGCDEEWCEVGGIGGHNAVVRGLAWSSGGEYLLSAGSDQTTRIHGEIPVSGPVSGASVWHEIGRPQVHGYDLVGVSSLGPLRFVSIADEKVARVFEAPREFVDIINNLGVAQLNADEGERPRAATVPPLGLSNKAVSEGNSYATARTKRRPFEGELAAVTLWPEIEKVFGHGYESISLAVSNDKKLMATACKATSPEHAVVRVYDTEKFQPVGQPLPGHSLTVTRIEFSPEDRFILTVSRDRSWRLFERNSESGYAPVAADKAHARIIWDCAWAPQGDIFATASRDKTVKVWRRPDADKADKWTAIATLKTAEAATAVAFAPSHSPERRILAVGLESGEIVIYSSSLGSASEWQLDLTINSRIAHVDQIHRLSARPSTDTSALQLASCSEDNTLKILTVRTAKP
ncbi:hypothetical protein WOLCODRAFT_89239 [Wolfiporia cocos MD-104 SS10]|uniref:Elongator complex protein 2 n=1 Tax=Wolfiporia cocos (strain MD-104) TaxID=742152 RepID=A0A2H3JIL8_WOLCO|nr:hypothetical protein WOLCODRAFT_89239 [Wolfiporia cocos MD-104 SS10]